MATEILQGSRTSFGPRETQQLTPGVVPSHSSIKELRYVIDCANLPSENGENDASIPTLPPNAQVLEVYSKVTEQLVEVGGPGTVLQVGLHEPDGTVTTADGLLPAGFIDANAAVGVIFRSSQSGATHVLASSLLARNTEAQVVASSIGPGSFTAGKVLCIIEYLDE